MQSRPAENRFGEAPDEVLEPAALLRAEEIDLRRAKDDRPQPPRKRGIVERGKGPPYKGCEPVQDRVESFEESAEGFEQMPLVAEKRRPPGEKPSDVDGHDEGVGFGEEFLEWLDPFAPVRREPPLELRAHPGQPRGFGGGQRREVLRFFRRRTEDPRTERGGGREVTAAPGRLDDRAGIAGRDPFAVPLGSLGEVPPVSAPPVRSR